MAGGQANGVWETAKTLGFGCLLWKEGQTWVLQRGTNGACYLYLFWGWHFLHLRQMKWSCKLNKGVLCVHLRTKLDETRENLPNIWVLVDAGLVHPPLCGWWVQMSIITLVSSMCVCNIVHLIYIYIHTFTYKQFVHTQICACRVQLGCAFLYLLILVVSHSFVLGQTSVHTNEYTCDRRVDTTNKGWSPRKDTSRHCRSLTINGANHFAIDRFSCFLFIDSWRGVSDLGLL